MPQWEYQVLDAALDTAWLNELGRNGWELAGMERPAGRNYRLVFKRPVQTEPPPEAAPPAPRRSRRAATPAPMPEGAAADGQEPAEVTQPAE
ncbi:MAG: hypothetical protein QOF51_2310 [Chloroflexota bacterium]|jgi:hypothetical protein|nr:hypothetical protein [Chloroflexota bacterium]